MDSTLFKCVTDSADYFESWQMAEWGTFTSSHLPDLCLQVEYLHKGGGPLVAAGRIVAVTSSPKSEW